MKTLKVTTAFLVKSIFILTLCIGSVSCEGPEGPEGEMGLQGPQGDQGPKVIRDLKEIKGQQEKMVMPR